MSEVCPTCNAPVHKVRNDPNGMLNDDQFDAVRAGDYYCKQCKGTEAGSGFKYWWKADLVKNPAVCNSCDAIAKIREGK